VNQLDDLRILYIPQSPIIVTSLQQATNASLLCKTLELLSNKCYTTHQTTRIAHLRSQVTMAAWARTETRARQTGPCCRK